MSADKGPNQVLRVYAHSTILHILSRDLPTLVPPYFWTTQGIFESDEFLISSSGSVAELVEELEAEGSTMSKGEVRWRS